MSDPGEIHQMVIFSTPSRTREEDSTEAIEVDSDEVDINSQPENTTLIIGRTPITHKGSSVQGGTILPNQVTKKGQSNVGNTENLANKKRSAERRNDSQFRPADNSRTMPRILINMATMEECS